MSGVSIYVSDVMRVMKEQDLVVVPWVIHGVDTQVMKVQKHNKMNYKDVNCQRIMWELKNISLWNLLFSAGQPWKSDCPGPFFK